MRLNEDGTATLLIGTQINGQGHATAYAQFIAGHLGLDYDQIEVIQGDTDQVASGEGTGGSRSIPLGVVSVDRAAIKLAGQIKRIAAEKLEAEADDLELADGAVRVAGTNRGMTLAELARSAEDRSKLSAYRRQLRAAGADLSQRQPSSPRSRSIRRPASSRSSATGSSTISASP